MDNLREKHSEIVKTLQDELDSYEYFMKNVRNFFETTKVKKHVHSVRYRLKDIDHLIEKIERKNNEDESLPEGAQKGPINSENIFSRITDISGIRILHLHLSQIEHIHNEIMKAVSDGEYALVEEPKAYTWDPESTVYFEKLGLKPQVKESFYTSIHYVLKPNVASRTTCCEVQVRTLLEEVWGEIDHTMNYPTVHQDENCKEQIKILARLIGTGSHLADAIMRRYK